MSDVKGLPELKFISQRLSTISRRVITTPRTYDDAESIFWVLTWTVHTILSMPKHSLLIGPTSWKWQYFCQPYSSYHYCGGAASDRREDLVERWGSLEPMARASTQWKAWQPLVASIRAVRQKISNDLDASERSANQDQLSQLGRRCCSAYVQAVLDCIGQDDLPPTWR